ncbi:hypothetical protein NOR_04521 [Metarhizium rileyi]|uniref:Uncharacterized protein n=1 Tax=Metarhizium rileyi (strain RCEF 4871) TaxID=1649241 RepID=A0A167E0Z7_METRR|nr:hypothetical protein NOR_04521 [Metarhizium rileyi RCEF 4871]
MAIRDRFRRALRKSDSSDTTISQTKSNTTTATTSSTSSLHKSTSSRFLKSFTFGRRSKDESQEESTRDRKNKKLHPSQRPLTLQNLKHQEMLSHFSMTFGASDPSQIESASFIGVSPCCTRAPSLEIDRAEASPSLADSPSNSVRD